MHFGTSAKRIFKWLMIGTRLFLSNGIFHTSFSVTRDLTSIIAFLALLRFSTHWPALLLSTLSSGIGTLLYYIAAALKLLVSEITCSIFC